MDKKFVIRTKMEEKDYRKFLYIATFLRNKLVIPFILGISALVALSESFFSKQFDVKRFFLMLALFFIVALLAVAFKVERINKKRRATDKTGAFNKYTNMTFYEDKLIVENEAFKSKAELKYNQFYRLLETKAYFIFYYNYNQASLVRKEDMENVYEFKEFIKGKFLGKYSEIKLI